MAHRGLTPALASLLLVAIVAVAAAIAYVWVSSYLGSFAFSGEQPQFRELLKVEGVRVENGFVVVSVRNIGSGKVTLKSVYVMKGSVAVAAGTLNVKLEPGQTAIVRVSAQIPPGEYTVKIVTATGVEAYAALPLSKAAQQPRVTITVSVDPQDGGTTDPPPGEYSVAAGSTVTVRAEPNPGYAFAKWLVNGSEYSAEREVIITVRGPTSLTAVFQ